MERRYTEQTNVLETTFHTEEGTLRLTDAMPVAEHEAYEDELWPEHEVLRRIECTEGAVEVEITCAPRPGYGRRDPRLEPRGKLGFFYQHREHVLVVRSEVPLAESDGEEVLSGRVRLDEGERRFLALAYDVGEPAVLPLLGDHAQARLEQSERYWRNWAGRCQYEGPHADAVVRSALTLKLMTFAASGALVAAPTTSLPEVIGGKKNYDYRYCWLRDASFTLRALFALGYDREGQSFFEWILQATRRTFPELNVLYTVYGTARAPEKTLDHLEGYRGSRPIHVGNQAEGQLQLDMYGELIAAGFEYAHRSEGGLDRTHRKRLRQLGEALCDRWQKKDNGLWELRSNRKHRTYSKAMCWVGLERLRQLHDQDLLDGKLPADRFARVQDQIRDDIEKNGFSPEQGTYTATYEDDRLDANLLLLAVYGYTDPSSERMQATYERVEEQLGAGGALLYRFLSDDGEAPKEGAFGICSFWAVEYLAKAGRLREAKEHFARMLAHANDVGLFSEEIDPESGAFLGNFPQAFTHVGLINAAMALADAEEDATEETAEKAGTQPRSETSEAPAAVEGGS